MTKTPFANQIFNAPYHTMLFIWIGTILFFAAIYFLLSFFPSQSLTTFLQMSYVERILNSIYFSIITATTIGYGDIVPQGLSKLIAACEGIFGFLVFATLISKLSSYKQEITLSQIHKLSFEENFRGIRESLFRMRRDFEQITKQVTAQHKLDDISLDNLAVAFKEGKSMISTIPDLYDEANELFILDYNREELLIEAVNRTLHRANDLITKFEQNKITIKIDDIYFQSLEGFIKSIDEIINIWQSKSPHGRNIEFDEIIKNNNKLRKFINKHQSN